MPILSAGMSLPMMMPFSMMAAANILLKCKASRKQLLHRLIRTAGHPAVKTDSRLRQCLLRACPDSAADERIHSQS